ncbi:MAG: type I restriction endonuclease [Muribaculum sp.]|nr:type I restriction endonuclease [Muribaculum sp.]
MNKENLKEKNFEEDIERWLLDEGGYERGFQMTYNKDAAIDLTVLRDFITETQPKEWARYQKIYGADEATDQFYKVLQDDISRYGLIYVLRNGIDDRGVKLRVAYFAPASELNEDLLRKYRANRLHVIRQFSYSSKHHNTIDMVLMLNGIPVVAIELKNQLTGQSVEDSKRQWMEDREPNEFLFHFNNRILAYFGLDLYEVAMTTQLQKEKTFFIPFNQGSNGAGEVGGAGNPEVPEGEYVTGYFWKRVLGRDALLSILQRYISVQKEEKIKIVVNKHGKEKEVKEESTKIIFPRFHQLDVVEKLTADTAENGVGRNYLVQHSAGSGKSNSIAWLTYRLASLHDANQRDIFNTVFVITDRRVLNQQLQNTVLGFDHRLGQVEVIKDSDPSSKLGDIIRDGNARIVICTLHRFPYIYDKVGNQSGRRYAVIVDEAHSSQSGKTADKTKAALADTDEALRELAEIEEKEVEQLEKEKDALMEDLLTQGQHSNLSFYAFTATPKPKTLQTFGIPYPDPENPGKMKHKPYHIYSMQQAIEEGFIKDVLQNFTPIGTAYEIAKNIAENPDYEETPATRAIKAFHDNHQHVIDQKIEIMVEKMREVTLQRMDGQAKAMIVSPSRAHALRYYMAMKEYCKQKGYEDIRPLVAFSGKLEFGGETYTESQLNSTPERRISEERLPLYFASDLYNVLIVADKYQTGFDEPKLHTMFVDKRLKDVKAVQTLSRLNRWQKLKKDTFVFDFSNTADEIKKAFEPFYKATYLEEPVDVNYVYRFRKDIAQYHVWTETDEEAFYGIYKKYRGKKNALAALSGFFKPIMSRFEGLEEERRFELRSKVKNFVRFYSYMAQIARTFDRGLYKAYVFADTLYKLLPKTPHEKPDLSKKIMLVNSQFKQGETVAITLEGNQTVKGESGNGGSKPDVKRDLLGNIIEKINILYKGDFSEADRVIVEAIVKRLTNTKEAKKLSKKANNNGKQQFMEAVFPGVFDDIATTLYEEQTEAFKSLFDNGEKYRQIMSQMAAALYDHFRDAPLVFDPEAFRKAMFMAFSDEFSDFPGLRPLNEVIEVFIKVLQAKSLPSLDGANDLLIDSFNRLFNDKKLTLVDRRRHFNTILTKFETYLKKLYWLIHSEELKNTRDPEKTPSLADCIFAFEELKSLKFKQREKYKRMYGYLDTMRNLRNDESHVTPDATEEEVVASSRIVTTLYLYITANSITELEMSDKI